MSSTLVVAEPGCTHEGDYEAIIRLMETARDCGADCFKPQWVSNPDKMIDRRTRRLSPDEASEFRRAYRGAYAWLSFPHAWHSDFRKKARDLGMKYACTTFIPDDVEAVSGVVDFHKISSFEAQDWEMLSVHRRMVDTGPPAPVIVSTGMMTRNEIRQSERLLSRPSYWLQCTSSYPSPLTATMLAAIDGLPIDGLSDHTKHLNTGAMAVTRGAVIIEAHFRLDDCRPDNPDYAVAFSPSEFRQYIVNIRDAEAMLGDDAKGLQLCEGEMARYQVRA